ncbi:MAG: hypothetical protein ACR652_00535 [Methylocystis sp.]|uniref:hypothetical protein n=1 Tax=Methylocystis sp. TaxID=1911079 RepID=UPI003DA34EDC
MNGFLVIPNSTQPYLKFIVHPPPNGAGFRNRVELGPAFHLASAANNSRGFVRVANAHKFLKSCITTSQRSLLRERQIPKPAALSPRLLMRDGAAERVCVGANPFERANGCVELIRASENRLVAIMFACRPHDHCGA